MLKNYITIAVRHLTRHKLFSLINMFCVAIGITFSLLIGSYITHEKSINSGLRNVSNQYMLKSNWKEKDLGLDITVPGMAARAIKEAYPNLVANYYRYNPVTNVVSAGDKHFKEDIAIGDTTLVSMYGFKVLYGNKEKVFKDNSSAVITETLAMKLFGQKDAVGKTITITNTIGPTQDYTVSAVLETIPYNSVINVVGNGYAVFVPTVGNRYYAGGDSMLDWVNVYIVGMIELQPGVKPSDLAKPFAQLIASQAPAAIKDKLEITLAPISSYYLENNNGAVQKIIVTLSAIAFFILLMAIINFVNINIGTSSYRIKEIGLRKVFGSARLQLVAQYITESLLLTLIAAGLSLLFYELLRPVFNDVLQTDLTPAWQFGSSIILFLVVLVLSVGLIAGIYPAFVLSSFNVIHAVKGKMKTAKGGLVLRKSLLVIQFAISIVVFICAMNVSRQVNYVFHKDIGYDKDQVMVITAFPKQWDSVGVLKMEAIRNELMSVPSVRSASLAFEVPERKPPGSVPLLPVPSKGTQPINIPTIGADEKYASTFGLRVTDGNFFNQTHFAGGEIVLNETAVKVLGLEKPVGKTVHGAGFSMVVAGVVKDFNYSSLQQKIEPVAFIHVKDNRSYRFLSLKLNTADMSRTITAIREKWKALSPNAPFEYTFMDEKFKSLYAAELKLKKASGMATALTVIIVLMGVFGVVAFTLTKRIKEIAMRKVLGADIKNIIHLFIKDYALLILLANIIAWPVAYMITGKWLDNYAYRINQDVQSYLVVTGFTFATAFLLIAAQCFKVASSNPVKSLRTE
jgi:putative ABC transport system permease protein